jgi:tRNA U38,U39,U40 pseudouridine synthase TruA|eukprot:COSAG02_NODE_1108_length_14539_cov_4.353393_4_plen_97_part_00
MTPRDLSKNGWSRSSRTDKGVHAIGCSVACKLVVPLASLEENAGHFSTEILDGINAHLPPSVRLVDGYRVSKVRYCSVCERAEIGSLSQAYIWSLN